MFNFPKCVVRGLLLTLLAPLLLTGCGLLTDSTDPTVAIVYQAGSGGEGSQAEVIVTAEDPESGIASLKLFRVTGGVRELLADTEGDGELQPDQQAGSMGARAAILRVPLPEGEYELVAVATNGVGRAVTKEKWVGPAGSTPDDGPSNDQAPVLTLASVTPDLGGFLDKGEVTVGYHVEDDHQVKSVVLLVSVDGKIRSRESETIERASHSGSFTVDLAAYNVNLNATVEFTLEATDSNGATVTEASPVFRVVDREAPQITFHSPLKPIEGDYASISFSVIDNDEVASVVLVINNNITIPFNPVSSGFYQHDWYVSEAVFEKEFGIHTLTAIAIDASGNESHEVVIVEIIEEEEEGTDGG